MWDIVKGMASMFVYQLVGILFLLYKCTDASGEGKAEVKDIILWQFLWPIPAVVGILMLLFNTGRNMISALPKKGGKER